MTRPRRSTGRHPDRRSAEVASDRFTPIMGDRRGAAQGGEAVEALDLWWRITELQRLDFADWLDEQLRQGNLWLAAFRDESGHWTLRAHRGYMGEVGASRQTSVWTLGPVVHAWPYAEPYGGARWERLGEVHGWLVEEALR